MMLGENSPSIVKGNRRAAERRAEADRIEAALNAAEAGFTSIDSVRDWSAEMKRRRAAYARIAATVTAAAGSFREDGAGVRIRYLAIASSSTSGIGGALRNWVKAARRKADEWDHGR